MDGSPTVSPSYTAGPIHLSPFRALMLEPRFIGDPATARLYGRPFGAVASRVETWRRRGRLSVDALPALYVHEYAFGGLTVRGIVGALAIRAHVSGPESAAVLPHEGVRLDQVDNLAERMQRSGISPAPILLTMDYSAALAALIDRVQDQPADRSFRDHGGQSHRFWRVQEPATMTDVNNALTDARAVIADGHHRYAAHLQLQARAQRASVESGLAMIIDQARTPLRLGAIHRVLHGVRFGELQSVLSTAAALERVADRAHAMRQLDQAAMVVTDGHRWLSARHHVDHDAAAQVLHDAVLPKLRQPPRRITYCHSADEAIATVRRRHELAVLLPPPTLTQIWRAAMRGTMLPAKATSFQPKPNPGTLMRSLRDA